MLTNGPEKLGFTLTRHCNSKCIMCSRSEQMNWAGPIGTPIDKIKMLLERYKATVKSVELGAFGEPLMYSAFPELVELLRSYGVGVNITTNGSRLHDTGRIRLLGLPGLLTISLDSLTKDIYESIRPGLTFEQVEGNVARVTQWLTDSPNPRRKVGINMVIMRRNMHEVYNVAQYAAVKKLDYFCPIRLYDFDRPELADEILSPTQPEVLEQITRARRDFKLLNINEYFTDRCGVRNRPPQWKHCRAPWSFLDFTPGGRAYVCCWTTGLNLGHWDDIGLWSGEAIRELRHALKSGKIDPEKFPMCVTCAQR